MHAIPILIFFAAFSLLHGQPPGAVAIKSVTVHPASGPVIERGTIVIRDGLIEAVGPNVAAPADAWTVEGIGLHAYPGLIDSLSHWGIPAAVPASAAANTPPARGPEDRPGTTSWVHAQDLVMTGEASLLEAREAGFTTAVVYPRNGIFSGQGAAMNLAGGKPGARVVASPAAMYVRFQTAPPNSFPGSLMGAIAYVRQIYLDAGRYETDRKEYAANARGRKRPDYDRALEGILEAPRVLLPASTRREIVRMIAFAKELGRPAILYGGHEAWQSVEPLRTAGLPLLIDLKWPERAKDADPDADESLRTLERYENAPSGPAVLAKAGVRFAFYSGGLTKAGDLRKAVKRAIDQGLDREDAVRALTLWPAAIYGFDDRAGTIEKGKIANIVVTDGDLFSERTKVRHVFVDGAKFDPSPAAVEKKEQSQ